MSTENKLNSEFNLLQFSELESKKPANTDFTKAMNLASQSLEQEIFNPNARLTPLEKSNLPVGPKTTYAGDNVDIYRYQKDYDPKGFNPYDPSNFNTHVAKETWSSALGKGFDSFADRFGNTFSDYWKDYGRMFDALVNFDITLLTPDEDQMIRLNWEEHKESMQNYVFIDPKQDDDIISKRSVSEFIGNAGFALGTFGGLAIELLADAAITAVTMGGGVGSFAATGVRFFTKLGLKKAGKETVEQLGKQAAIQSGKASMHYTSFVQDMVKGYNMADNSTDALRVAQRVEQTGDLANATRTGAVSSSLKASIKELSEVMSLNINNIINSKNFGDLALQVGKGVPIAGQVFRYGEKIALGAKGGLSAGNLTGIGFRGFRRMAQEFNFSSTEAAFEAISTYGDTLDQMIKQYQQDNNGQNPDAEQFEIMRELASKASFSNYKTNFGILAATNKIQFGGLFNKFGASNIWMKEILADNSGKFLGVNKMFGKKELLGKVYKKGYLGTLGISRQIARDFGKRQAVYEVGKSFMRNFGRFEITEGLQENLQETSNSAWRNYYAGLYNGTKYTLEEAFDKSLAEQFTKQGFKTFLQGALTGSLIRIPTMVTQKTIEKVQQKAISSQYSSGPENDPFRKAEKQQEQDLAFVNTFMQSLSEKKFEDTFVNFKAQTSAALGMTEAAAKNMEYEWNNHKDNSMIMGVIAANRLGMGEVYAQVIRDMGKEMSNEEFEAQFGVNIKDTKYSSPLEFAEEVARDITKYDNAVEKVRKKIKNLADPLMFAKDSKEYISSMYIRAVQEEMIRIVALNQLKGMKAVERVQKLSKELASNPDLANSSQYALRVLTDYNVLSAERGHVEGEIGSLEESLKAEGLTPELKKEITEKIKDKKEEAELLKQWHTFHELRENVIGKNTIEEEVNGEKVQKEVDIKDSEIIFIGKKIKESVQELNENDEIISEEEAQYDLYHDDVIDVMKKIIAVKNKQAGINKQITEEHSRDALVKLVDITRLDRDARDYMQAVDSLFNTESYKQTIERMLDGRFKAKLLDYVDGIYYEVFMLYAKAKDTKTDFESEDFNLMQYMLYLITASESDSNAKEIYDFIDRYANEALAKVENSNAYKNLVTVYTDETFGTQHTTFVQNSIQEIEKIIKEHFEEVLKKEQETQKPDSVTQQEYEDFKDGRTSSFVKFKIASKLSRNEGETLTEQEKEIYDFYKDQIDILKEEILENKTSLKEEQTEENPDEFLDEQIVSTELYDKLLEGDVNINVLYLIANKVANDNYSLDSLTVRERHYVLSTEETFNKVLETVRVERASEDYYTIEEDLDTGQLITLKADGTPFFKDENGDPYIFESVEEIRQYEKSLAEQKEKATESAIEIKEEAGEEETDSEPTERFILREVSPGVYEIHDMSMSDTLVESIEGDLKVAEKRLNTVIISQDNTDFALEYLKELENNEDFNQKVADFINQAVKYLRKYEIANDINKGRYDVKVPSIREYIKTKKHKKFLDNLKKAIAEAKDLKLVNKRRSKKANEVVIVESSTQPENLFGNLDSTQTPGSGPVMTIDSLNKLLEAKRNAQTVSNTDPQKADIKIGKVGNTNYEVKSDGVYFEGKKLDNPENKSHKKLIEDDIERRREEDLQNGELFLANDGTYGGSRNVSLNFYSEVQINEGNPEGDIRTWDYKNYNGTGIFINRQLGIAYIVPNKTFTKQPQVFKVFINKSIGRFDLTNPRLINRPNIDMIAKAYNVNADAYYNEVLDAVTKYDTELAALENNKTVKTQQQESADKINKFLTFVKESSEVSNLEKEAYDSLKDILECL